jgi:Asp-tRNA(Asn)/Glu-tRNA(Gln) amidotransferase A subunit family amidase
MNDYRDHDALGLAELVRSGQVSAGELLDDAIAAVVERNGALNAVVTEMYDEARATIAAGVPDGPFAGVPFLLKDLRASVAGVATTSGSHYWVDNVAENDSETVRRFRCAGFVIFAKTNTPEFGCCPSTEGALFGATQNPWQAGFSAGGSSGGSAAAVASGMVPAAHGSDGGGSLRIPASCCGAFSLKPTRGRVPAGPTYGEAWNGLSTEGVITRTVRDSAAMLDAVAGPAPGDPYWAPPPARPYADEAVTPPGQLRVAVQREALNGAAVHEDCVAAVDRAAAALEALGHAVVDAVPSYDVKGTGDAFTLLIAANVQAGLDRYGEETGRSPGPGDLEHVVGVLRNIGHDRTAADLVRATWAMHGLGRDIAPFFETHDVLLSPVVATPPPPLGVLDPTTEDLTGYLTAVFNFIPFTSLANLAGVPAMAVPWDRNADNLPVGVHFTAGYGREDVLFRLAGQLEEAHPWPLRSQ